MFELEGMPFAIDLVASRLAVHGGRTDLAWMRPEVWAIQWPFGRGRSVGPHTEAPRDLKKLATPQRDENSRVHFKKKRCLFDNLLCIAID